ncbi:MAG: GIN domain-containing protein, partial [Alphaproteobacteria bacterium]
MSRNWLLGCASVLVVAGTVALAAPPAPPAAPAAPAAPRAAGAHSAHAVVTRSGRYDVKAIEIEDVFGHVTVKVTERGPVTLSITGPKPVVDAIRVHAGNKLHISEEHKGHVWNWREWFEFKRQKKQRVSLVLTAPRGTPLRIDDFVGEFNVGNLQSPVHISAAAAKGTVGNVQSARIELAGSGTVDIGTVSEQLRIEIAGSGTIRAGASAGAVIEIGGSGDAKLGPVLGGLKVEIAGSGDVHVASVNGPTSIETAGAGNVRIDTGEADPFKVSVLGAGNVVFGGEAVNP